MGKLMLVQCTANKCSWHSPYIIPDLVPCATYQHLVTVIETRSYVRTYEMIMKYTSIERMNVAPEQIVTGRFGHKGLLQQ